ncbi:MAG: aminoacyl-tRNA hydrolase [Nitrospirota bacterium]
MWIVAGLGNPGPRYAKTRHNAGFMVVDALAGRYRAELRERQAYSIWKGSVEGTDVILLEPLTFMNRSGLVVWEAMKKYNTQPENLIVVHDDIDLETGKLKIRKKGSSGGHKGIESIIESIGTRDFIRVKVGVGREEDIPVEDYVLSRFRKEETLLIREAVGRASDAVCEILKNGVDRAMNKFN